MAHMYMVEFDIRYNNIRTDYYINVKANNQKQAKDVATQKWITKYKGHKRCPHQFHMEAKRTADDVPESGFRVKDQRVVDKSKDPFWRWVMGI